jgi:hypothetical protein
MKFDSSNKNSSEPKSRLSSMVFADAASESKKIIELSNERRPGSVNVGTVD